MTEPIDRLVLLLTPNSSLFVMMMLEQSVCNPHSFVRATARLLRHKTLLMQVSFLAMSVLIDSTIHPKTLITSSL
jgi:hypothetical protein